MLETRPGLLRKVALLSKALGILLLIVGVIGLIAGLTAGGNMPAIVTTLVKVAAFWILITGVFFFVILYAVGDIVLLLLGLEERTRAMREQVARSGAASQTARAGGVSGARANPTPRPPQRESAPAARPAQTGSAAEGKGEGGASEEKEDASRRATEQAKRAAEIAERSKREGSEKK